MVWRDAHLHGFYQLKGNLVDVQLEKGSTRLVLIFDKRSDPQLSAEKLRGLEGFVVCSFKKVTNRMEKAQQAQLNDLDANGPNITK